jgi:ABC-type branched-subunit amino acid transport system substrate-binding protein
MGSRMGIWCSRRTYATLAMGGLLVLAACGGASSGPSTSPIPVAELFPTTGVIAALGQFMLKGAETAVKDVNSHGGVMGRQLVQYSADTGGDAADGVTAFRQLDTHSPTFMVGPTGLEFASIQPLFDAAKLPSFVILGSTQYDSMTDPWTYRITPSDSVLGSAMAYYAIQKGLTKCSILFASGEAAQALVPAVKGPFEAHGGTVLANIALTPDQSSYSSEILKAFANNPQCIFVQTDAQTAGTLFAAARELGHLNVPFIGSDQYNDINIAKAIGLQSASKWVTGMAGAAPTGPAYAYLLKIYKADGHIELPSDFASAMYDAVVLAALAMTDAKSTDPTVWNTKVLDVSNPAGTVVYTYAQGVALLKQGKKINYDGASGPVDFNAHHAVFNGFEVVQFSTSGQPQDVSDIPASALLGF